MIGKKVYVLVDSSAAESAKVTGWTTEKPEAGEKAQYYVELDLTKANDSWEKFVGLVATNKGVKGAGTTGLTIATVAAKKDEANTDDNGSGDSTEGNTNGSGSNGSESGSTQE